MHQRITLLLVAIGFVAAACRSSATDETTTTASVAGVPATALASVIVEDQMSDGTTIVVKTVELPAAGFIAVHADNGGSPGPVIGHSDLLPAGISEDVTVLLDTALEGISIVWPMAHIDMDGEYTFMPPDDAIDILSITEDGNVAVIPVQIDL